VEQVLDAYAGTGRTVYVRKQIVHNSHVVAGLRERGAVFVDELEDIPAGDRDAVVVYSAHGVSPAVRQEALRRGLEAVDATCPLVAKVHAEARRHAARGDTIVLIGHAGHEEVEGTLGEAPGQAVLVESAADVAALDPPDRARVAFLTQTTLAVDETDELIGALKARFPGARGPGADDICYATTNRQAAISEVARQADVVLVVGSANSSNSVRMAEVARRAGVPAYLVDDASQVEPDWLRDARVIGLSAGASAPQHLVDAVIAEIARHEPVQVTELATAVETQRFAPPGAWAAGYEGGAA
jgi:4-hydroxy-3-methylbut-2-enyl diphosphate reductase